VKPISPAIFGRPLVRLAVFAAGVAVALVLILGARPFTAGPVLGHHHDTPQPDGNGAPTKGLLTNGAVLPDGTLDLSRAPDFIPASNSDGEIVGYVATKSVFLDLSDTPVPVFGDDLRTIVGHMAPGRGFVPLGTSPDTVPLLPVETPAPAP
jgi:hypothetical protein